MSLGKIEPRIWLTMSRGKVERNDHGNREAFSYVEGRLEDIVTNERPFKGQIIKRWFINMRGEAGEHYVIVFPYSSGTFKSIALALASAEDITSDTIIRLEPYTKGEYTNIVTWADGVKLDWISKELPPVRTTTIGGRTLKDDTERMQYIEGCVTAILKRLRGL